MYKKLLLLLAVMFCCTGFKVPNIDVEKALDAAGDAYKAATLTDKDIQQLGKQSADEMDSQNKIAASSDAYAKRLAKIVKGLEKEDGLKLNFKVYLVRDVNAFALPDGSVRVFAGLMDIMTDDELFFVIGHEIGHVKNGDSMDAYRVAYTASATRKGAAAAGGAAAKLSASQLGEIGEAVLNAQFSQSQESAADLYGFNLMKKYKKDTASAVSGLKKLGGSGQEASTLESLLSSHPEPAKRAAKLDSLRK
ncbi:M48 family metallopeptidase [Desulfovibrio sp. OttesenSCG-928-C06]|nr:M48 family metallopeptidase [Desulfovibrio sp. OttesenSCG-928-C06]